MNYDEVIEKYEKASNMPTRPTEKTYSENHIFDEDKSVKWNREEVARRNEEIKKERAVLQTNRYKALMEAEEAIVDYLHKNYSLISKSKIEKLFESIYNDFYRDHFDYKIQGVIDMCEEYLDIFSEED